MNIRFYFQEINKASQEELEKYLAGKKLDRLTRLLQHGNLALAKFVVNAKCHLHHNIFVVRLGLEIAKNDFEAEEAGHNLIEAFDLAFNKLVYQLRKAEKSRHDK
jgi:ribosome-associated translation inhibitor RaiA